MKVLKRPNNTLTSKALILSLKMILIDDERSYQLDLEHQLVHHKLQVSTPVPQRRDLGALVDQEVLLLLGLLDFLWLP